MQLCRECFYHIFEEEVHATIKENNMFTPGERIAVAASGGKDSTVLAHVMTTLNARHGYASLDDVCNFEANIYDLRCLPVQCC